MVLGAIAGVVGAGLGIFGAVSSSNSQNKAASKQYDYDKKKYNYDWKQALAAYDYQLQSNQIASANTKANIDYAYKTAQQDYAYNLAINDFSFKLQQQQYKQSDKLYNLQTKFNKEAAVTAHAEETRRFEELVTGLAFEQQDMLVKSLQEQGLISASGITGRSGSKAAGAALASFGRNQSILAESLLSATKATNLNQLQIEQGLYGADFSAFSQKMLDPIKAPDPLKPLKAPMPTFQDPLKPVKAPKPIKGAAASAMPGILSSVGSFANLAASNLSWKQK